VRWYQAAGRGFNFPLIYLDLAPSLGLPLGRAKKINRLVLFSLEVYTFWLRIGRFRDPEIP
jgi:hypothetical protein